MLRNVRTTFNYMDKDMRRKIITRPKIEYAEVVFSPQKK